MSLPHPLGDTNPGDLFYPGSPAVTVADAPGVAGSRAVEFGEDGLSSAPNRMGYALAKNEEYIDARIEAKLSKMEFSSFVPAGGNGGSYTFTGVDFFVGGADYLPETQQIRDALVTVLDQYRNELIDANGNRVAVKEIKNSGDAASIVGDTLAAGGDDDGFYNTGAIIRFQTVNPVTGVVVNAGHTLSDGVQVFLAHGIARTIESAATIGQEQHMRDAMFAGASQALGTIPAAALHADGSKKMFGDLDINGHDLINPINVIGQSGQDLTLRSLQALYLKDSNLSGSGVPVSDANNDALVSTGINDSLIGKLNAAATDTRLHGANRALNRTGSFTAHDATALIDYPQLDVFVGGELLSIAAGTTGPVADISIVYQYVWVEKDGTVSHGQLGVIPADSVVVYWFVYATGAFQSVKDMRWPSTKRGDHQVFFVGDGVGADFVDLNTFFDVLPLHIGHETYAHIMYEVVIVGTALVTSALVIGSSGHVVIRGAGGRDRAFIRVDFDLGASATAFTVGPGFQFKDLTFLYNGAVDAGLDSYALGYVYDARVILENVSFGSAGGDKWYNVVSLGRDSVVRDCAFADTVGTCVFASIGNVVDHCRFNVVDAACCVDAVDYVGVSDKFVVVQNCRAVTSGVFAKITSGVVRDCFLDISLATGGSAVEVTGPLTLNKYVARISGLQIKSGPTSIVDISSVGNASWHFINVLVEGCVADGGSFFNAYGGAGIDHKSSKVVVRDCAANGGFTQANFGRVEFVKNRVLDNASINVYRDGTLIEGNSFRDTSVNGVTIDVFASNVIIRNNEFDLTGGVLDKAIWVESTASGALIEGNKLGGNTSMGIAIAVDSTSAKVTNNAISGFVRYGIYNGENTIELVIRGNRFSGGINHTVTVNATTDVKASAIMLACLTTGVLTGYVEDNIFENIAGSAIRVGDGDLDNNTWGPKRLSVKRNSFINVQGRFLLGTVSEDWKWYGVVMLGDVTGITPSYAVDENYFQDCGFEWTYDPGSGGTVSEVALAGGRGSISRNTINGIVASGHDLYSDGHYHIYLKDCYSSVVSGNQINHDWAQTPSKEPGGDFFGIYSDTPHRCIISGNVIDWFGVTALSLDEMNAFKSSSDDKSLWIGNLSASNFDDTGGALASAHFLMASSDALFLGNFAGSAGTMHLPDGASGCMAVANLAKGATMPNKGQYPTATAYNTNTEDPRDDLNRII